MSDTSFLRRSTFGISIAGCFAALPFASANLLQGQVLIGSVGLLFVFANMCNLLYLHLYGYSPRVNFYVLAPIILLTLWSLVSTQGLIGMLWCYPGLLSLYSVLPERRAWIANGVFLLGLIPITLSVFEFAIASRMIATLMVVSVFSIIGTREISKQKKRLISQALQDPLTKLLNRTSLARTIEASQQQSLRSGVPVTLLSLDIDHFKKINDTYGHATGDRILCGVARILQQNTRKADYVFRVGGEEFLVVVHNASLEDGIFVAEKLRNLITSAPLLKEETVTGSFGVAALDPDESPENWLLRADRYMYCAKASGRDCVSTGEQATEPDRMVEPTIRYSNSNN